ncbi:BREX-3 system P-loop-containing protein BrxF [Dongshaea marina]|uniref:BREX-3 system P-loop-containing protein BrxF n=1 Tax=Dongshaea marina TaxID=2047966 RepID=UPI000D3E7203|nr:BREX-3 system P-loop-containing protein BrxF [Dongshaea marina]
METSITLFRLKDQLIQRVQNACREAEYQSYKLVLVAIPPALQRAAELELLNSSISLVNLSKELSRKLVSQSIKDRVKRLEDEVIEIANDCGCSVWMTKLDVLFEPSLENDPMILLKMVSKSQLLVAIWPGDITQTSMVYSKPGKPDYKSYLLKDLNDIQVIDACNGVMK